MKIPPDFRMNPNDENPPPSERTARLDPGIPETSPADRLGDSSSHQATRGRPWWFNLMMVAPALLVIVSLAIDSQRHRFRDDGNAVAILISGFIASVIVAVVGANAVARQRHNRRSAALVGLGALVGIVLLNIILMFGGCLVVVVKGINSR
jgi:hypothetical protein